MDRRHIDHNPLQTNLLRTPYGLVGCVTYYDARERRWVHMHVRVDEAELARELVPAEYNKMPGTRMWYEGRMRCISLAIERILVEHGGIEVKEDIYFTSCLRGGTG